MQSPSESPTIQVALLNACPICNLWYSCHENMFAECRHSFHPWCLAKHSLLQKRCAISDYELEFREPWCTTCDIRPHPLENTQFGLGKPAPKKPRKMPTIFSCQYLYFLIFEFMEQHFLHYFSFPLLFSDNVLPNVFFVFVFKKILSFFHRHL
jgi:hypothetical protein